MAEPCVIPSIEALAEWEGKPLGVSDWATVSQEQIDAFAKATGDHQWIHVDVERARRESPFGGPVAHGYLTLSLVPVLLPQVVEVTGAARVVNYGVEKMRLQAPVPAGARVRLHAELRSVRAIRGGAARVSFALTVEVEGTRKPACKAEVIYVYFP